MEFTCSSNGNYLKNPDTGIVVQLDQCESGNNRESYVNPLTGLTVTLPCESSSEQSWSCQHNEGDYSGWIEYSPCYTVADGFTPFYNTLTAMSYVCNNGKIDYLAGIGYFDYSSECAGEFGGTPEVQEITNEIREETTELGAKILIYEIHFKIWLNYTDNSSVYHYRELLGGEYHFKVTLSGENKLDNIVSGTESGLNSIPLNNDILYPWRQDGYCSVAPIIYQRETLWAGLPIMEWWDDCVTEEGTGITECYNGAVVGGLLEAGQKSYFQINQVDYRCCEETWYENTAGQWSTSSPIPTCKAWTENYPFKGSNQHLIAGGGWRCWIGDVYWVQKWAEKPCPAPAQNWTRPAGWRDRYAINEEKLSCITNVSGLNITTEETLGTLSTPTRCFVEVTGSIDAGIYLVTGSGTSYVLAAGTPETFPPEMNYNAGTGLIAVMRFSSCWPILGKAKATAVLNESGDLVTVTTSNALYLKTSDDITLEGTSMGAGLIHGAIITTGVKEFTIAVPVGTTLAGFTHRIYATGIPLAWIANERKGNAVYVSEATGEPDRELITFEHSDCGTVLCISPSAGDEWEHMVKKPLPTMPAPGSNLARSCFHQHMEDALFQVPHRNCITKVDETLGKSGCAMVMDDGSCKDDLCFKIDEETEEAGSRYYPPLIREAVLAVPTSPAGASLPPGVTIDPAQYALPSFAAITCEEGLQEVETPWGLYNRMRASACSPGCRFNETYRLGNGIKCL